ncbi:MAG: hypothetical protein ACXV2C_01720 [Candidatus Bathyarchaeia archaeon]
MITQNNWLKSNILDMANDPNVDLRVWFDLFPFNKLEFIGAVDYTVLSIGSRYADRDLYLALSGGADSEFVLRKFVAENIPITPIVVYTPMNSLEMQYAQRVCRQLKVTPIVLDLTEDHIFRYYQEMVYAQIRSKSLNCVYQLIATAKANALGGVIVNGDNIISDEGTLVSDAFEYFTDVFYKDSIGFYYFTPEICRAMVAEIRDGESCSDYKERVYGVSWRPKIYPVYSQEFMLNYDYKCPKLKNGNEVFSHGTKEDFLKMMEPYLV